MDAEESSVPSVKEVRFGKENRSVGMEPCLQIKFVSLCVCDFISEIGSGSQ